ncbi:MAG TPA: flagellar biosynthetic protein FliR [Lautropia sp.]|nr:flagellar biosynthetic protein FliR [Lautropia sp.]
MISITEAQLLAWLGSFLLPFFRILGIFTSAPILSARAFPARIRIGLALLVAVVAAPLGGSPASMDDPDIWLLLASEMMIGLAIGLVARMILSAVDLAGEIIGLQMGLSFAGFFDPASGSNTNAVGRLLGTLSLAAFVAADGPSLLIAATVQSIESAPATAAGSSFFGRLDIGSIATTVFELGMLMALPYMALLLFVNLALGIVSRVAPQLNVFAIGFPITIASGLVLLTLGLPLMAQPFSRVMEAILKAIGF